MVNQTLKGQVALITGGLGDIGKAIAIDLAQHGAAVAISDIAPAGSASDLLAQLGALGRRARYDRVDVADAEAVARWVDAVEADLGVASLVVPNAAIVTLARATDISPADWQRELSVNLSGGMYVAQAAAKRLLHHNTPGRIVFIGSWAAHQPHPHMAAYSAAKAGLRMFAKCLALELAPKGILVNEVAPGYVDAGLTGQLWAKSPAARETGKQQVPTHELITPAEVAAQVTHLCDPANRHITGSTILMDGGLSLTSVSHHQKDPQ